MKKLIWFILAFTLVLAIAACGGCSGGNRIAGGSTSSGSGDAGPSGEGTDDGSGGNLIFEPDDGDSGTGGDASIPPTIPPTIPPSIDENQVSDFEYRAIAGGVEITRFIGTSFRVGIPETIEGEQVISIAEWAFATTGIMEVYIPDSVISIGNYAFAGNEALTTVHLGNGVTNVFFNSFGGCVSLPVDVWQRIQSLIYSNYEIIEFSGLDWLVLEERDDRALILSLEIIETRQYHSTSNDITWEQSDIREYLNSEFYNSFSAADQARIIETTLINSDNPIFSIPGGNDTTDKIFLLSIDEVQTYFDSNTSRTALNAEGNVEWWLLRSPGSHGATATFVDSDGDIYSYPTYGTVGIRPALWLIQ